MDNLLPHILALTNATSTGADKWLGHCPTHGSKRHRDFSVKLAGTRILLHCFAGCPKPAICQSLGLELKDLFTDTLTSDPQRRREAVRERDLQRHLREQQAHQEGTLIDVLKAADDFVSSRQGLDISGWSDEKLNNELGALADGYHLLENEDLDGCLR